MSFEMNLPIVLQETDEFEVSGLDSDGDPTIWQVESIVRIGTVRAISEVSCFSKKMPRSTAQMCLVDAIWPLFSKAVDRDLPSHVAPRFTVLRTDQFTTDALQRRRPNVGDWRQELRSGKISGDEFIKPARGTTMYDQVPDQRSMEWHNYSLDEGVADLSMTDLIAPTMPAPILWFDCSRVSGWIDEWKKGKYWLELQNYERALAYFTMWETVLREMGRLEARCLFYFEYPSFPYTF